MQGYSVNKTDCLKIQIAPISMNKLKNRGNFIAKCSCNILIIKMFLFTEYPYVRYFDTSHIIFVWI